MESTTHIGITDAEWMAARDAGLLTATPGTNAQDAAIHKFAEAIRAAYLRRTEPVAEVIECPVMGGQTVKEIDGRWKFLRVGSKLYAA